MMEFKKIHFKVIPCDFGPITKKENAENITLGDFQELRNQLKVYKLGSKEKFGNFFCTPILGELAIILQKYNDCKWQGVKLNDFPYLLFEEIQKLAGYIEERSSEYINYETTDRGKLKIQHRVSAKRVEQVRKLKEICSKISNMNATTDQETRYKEDIGAELKTMQNIVQEIEKKINDNKKKTGVVRTLLGLDVKKCFEKCIDEAMEASKNKKSAFYKTVSKINTHFQNFDDDSKENANKNKAYEDNNPLAFRNETYKKNLLESCGKILTVIKEYLDNESKREKRENFTNLKNLNQYRVRFMKAFLDIVTRTSNFITQDH